MKNLFTFFAAILFTGILFAQSPQKMSYQAVVRDASNKLVVNHQVGMQISIVQSSEDGTAIYTETQTPTTNANGLVSIKIGSGAGFTTIDWANGPYFIKTETDPSGGTSYTITGVSQLLSVPYALYAEKSGSPGPQGDKGDKGDKGDQGPRGIQGYDGANGLTTSVNGVTQINGAITLTKSNIGLGNVDNTSDANKPISSDTQTALNLKVDKVDGKDLSSEDYSTAEKAKLAAISGDNTGDQDLSGYATTSTVTTGLATKVDKVTGKDLSSEDYTTAEKAKLAAISGDNTGDQDLSGYATTSTVTTGLATKVDKVTGKDLSSEDYSTAEKAKLAAISGDNTGDQDLSGYATTSTVTTGLATKVDKVTGKGLSSEDYSTAEKAKLNGIAENANVGVVPNAGITGATKTKITYDTKGLVTAGTDATTADIAASTNKNYVTDAQKIVIGNTSGSNTGDNAPNTLYSGLESNATHTGDASGATALTVKGINGVALSILLQVF